MRSKTFSKDDMLNPYTDPNLERRARTALSLIKRHGRHMEMVDERVIQYGLEHNLFTQEQLDDADEEYCKYEAGFTLRELRVYGINSLMGNERVIQYGLEHNLFTQEQLDDAQGKYNKFKELERKLEESKGGNEK